MIASASFGLLILALIFQVIWILVRPGVDNFVSLVLLPLATLGLLIDLTMRSLRISFVALTNTYEALIFLSCALGILLSWLQFRLRRQGESLQTAGDARRGVRFVIFGGSLLMLLFLALASSPLVPDTIRPPVPALRSGWLVLHVSLAFVGEAFFALSFVSALLGLTTGDSARRIQLDRITYTAIAVGYPIFTIGALIFGAVWAQFAWGRYWGWDPKETWALVTWLTYTLYLHLRISGRGNRNVLRIVAVIGFLFTLFTFFGVNYLLSGLHSYG